MKPTIRNSESGSILVLTVITSALIGSVLCSYLVLISSRNEVTMRGLAWNSAIPVLEAGIEEALTHLHDDKTPTANQWTGALIKGKKVYWKRRDFADGSYCYVTNMNVGTAAPVIFSAGYVRAPLGNNEYISRLVKVTTTNPASLFNRAIAANGLVKLSGSAIVDGYNSEVGPYSASNRNAAGGIATNSKDNPAISIGSQAHLYGSAVTGSGGSVYVVPGGSVGDIGWNDGTQGGWVNNDMNFYFQENAPPDGTMTISQLRGQTNALRSGKYMISSFSSGDRTEPLIIKGDVTLWVTGNFTIGGNGNNAGYVYIEPQAKLMLYVGGAANISGGGIVNGAGSPANFSYLGLPTNKTLRYSGTADFVGTINAPQADFVIGGGASVYGGIICNSFTGGGGSGVHYDKSLSGGGMFMVTSWREL